MKKIMYLFIASLALVATSCDKDFEEINTSPNNSEVTDPNLLLASAIISSQNIVYNAQVGGDMGLCWAQHWSKVQYNDEEKYIPRRAVMNSVWSTLYANVIKESKVAYDFAGASGNTNLQAIALVIQANTFQILTDIYGPVPFSEAVVDGIIKPKHDSQEEVYDGILALLDNAETLFASGTGSFTSSADLVYGGDVEKWRKLAMSLKLKALMRISKVRNVSTEVQNVVASGFLMSSNADSAQLTYTSSQPDANPIYETIVFSNRPEYKVSSVLVDKLNSLSDPRLSVFAQLNNASAYVGNVPGVQNPGNYNGFSSPGTFYLDPTLPGVILSYAQVEMYLAEAANENIIPGGIAEAKSHYLKAIDANFEFNNLLPDATYTSSAAVDFTTQVEAREKIATQMWLLLYGQGIEAWTEWRRTGFPALSPVVDAAISQIPSRFYFSTDSSSFNQSNYDSASATLSNGDSMLSKVWWMN
jgi:hypothetical protein